MRHRSSTHFVLWFCLKPGSGDDNKVNGDWFIFGCHWKGCMTEKKTKKEQQFSRPDSDLEHRELTGLFCHLLDLSQTAAEHDHFRDGISAGLFFWHLLRYTISIGPNSNYSKWTFSISPVLNLPALGLGSSQMSMIQWLSDCEKMLLYIRIDVLNWCACWKQHTILLGLLFSKNHLTVNTS